MPQYSYEQNKTKFDYVYGLSNRIKYDLRTMKSTITDMGLTTTGFRELDVIDSQISVTLTKLRDMIEKRHEEEERLKKYEQERKDREQN